MKSSATDTSADTAAAQDAQPAGESPSPGRSAGTRRFARHTSGATTLFLFLLAVAFVTRVILLAKSARDVDFNLSLPGAFLNGLVFDAGFALFPAAVAAVILAASPPRLVATRVGQICAAFGVAVGVFASLFILAAEWLFWDEFSTRFNFIAVDYLVYTQEVVANIRESYNMPLIFGALTVVAVAIALLLRRTFFCRWISASAQSAQTAKTRWRVAGLWVLGAAVSGCALDASRAPSFINAYNGELARNGPWSFFAAFWDNELDYDRFYATLPREQAFTLLRKELDGKIYENLHWRCSFEPETWRNNSLHEITPRREEIRPNIIQITVESLSADFLGVFNPPKDGKTTLTPNLDALAPQSLLFENFYATGTRTDRGMEALSLALPPTPGRSIIKRPANAKLFTLGSVLRTRGYDTAFIYGGYGYFDNMNAFFGNNGYRIVDRGSVAKSDITFANAWGACDEDLLRWTLREADNSAAAGKPFHFFVMTTSNHRPYTFPEGRIDLPSKTSGRKGAVKYTDHAIGAFLREAATKPWFKNTVFVIVADHCASSAGKTALPVANYHIPLFIHAPGGQIAPGRVATLTSQIDYAPTLLGLLGWEYDSRFFGRDVLATPERPGRALIGTYQKLGYFDGSRLSVLSPRRGTAQYNYDPATHKQTPAPAEDPALRDTTIAYYQTASWLYRNEGYPEARPKLNSSDLP